MPTNNVLFILSLLLSIFPTFLTPFACATSKFTPSLYLVKLNKHNIPSRHRALTPDTINYICPSNFSPSKFTIECYTGRTNNPVSFSVNGFWSRTEKRAPYFITGDKQPSMANPWVNYPKKALVSCWTVDGTKPEMKVTVMVYFSCEYARSSEEKKTRATPCAIAKKSKAKPTVTAKRKKSSMPSPTPTSTAVAVSAEEDFPLTEYDTLRSGPDPTSKRIQAQLDEGCILLNPLPDLKPNTSLPSDWTIDEGRSSLTFRRGDTQTYTTSAGLQPLLYTIKPPMTSQYAIVLDMTTSGKSDHNDVWVHFTPGGLQGMLRRVPIMFTGWTKGYHNRNGRAALLFTVDFTPNDISTRKILKKGSLYTFGIAGRSSMVTLHHIVMFPCKGDKCQRSWHWKKSLSTCLPDAVIDWWCLKKIIIGCDRDVFSLGLLILTSTLWSTGFSFFFLFLLIFYAFMLLPSRQESPRLLTKSSPIPVIRILHVK